LQPTLGKKAISILKILKESKSKPSLPMFLPKAKKIYITPANYKNIKII